MAALLALVSFLAFPALAAVPQEPAAKPADAADALELADLTAVDLSKRRDLHESVSRLRSTFQIFLDLRTMRKPKGGAQASPSEPHLRAECTASYIGDGRVASAQHCIHGTTWSDVVFRRWRFRAAGGRLAAVGHVDHFVHAEPVASIGDLVILRLDTERGPAVDEESALAPAGSGEPAFDERFLSVGYPNEHSARPFAAVGCRVAKQPKELGPLEYHGACRIAGGMSGGPQIRSGSAVQLGVNSSSHGDTVTQPRLSEARPREATSPAPKR